MRTMMKIRIPAESGNRALREGLFQKLVGEFSEHWHPEAMYREFIRNNFKHF